MDTSPEIAVTVDAAARRVMLSRSKLYAEIAAGRLRSYMIGRARRVLVSDLVTWLTSQGAA